LQSQQPSPGPERIRFEDFEADLRAEELSRGGRKVRLAQQSFRVLAMLLEKPGQLVTRQELRARLWPGGTLIEYDQGLNTAVNRLREALRDSAETPRFIETLPKRGYRFIATVEPQPPPSTSAQGASEPTPEVAVGIETAANESFVAPGSRAEVRARAGAAKGGSAVAAARRVPWVAVFAAAVGLTIVLLAAGLVVLATRYARTRPMSGRHVTVFTSLPGQEIAPTFSPDGSHIAFAWNGGEDAGDRFDLYVKSLGSERLLRLTYQPAAWITPAWSPDGSSIAFVRRTEEGVQAIFVVPALGGSERSIVSGNVAVGLGYQISWSPDGRQLAYAAYSPHGDPRVALVELESLRTHLLVPAPKCVEAGEPAFSPDGKQIALVCVSSSAAYGIYLVQLPHGPMHQLASVMGRPRGLAWAADGSSLIFSKDPGNGGELWQLSPSGEMTQLPFGEEASAPAVAPKGGRMAYVRGRETLDIWRADLTAAHPEESATKLVYSTRSQAVARYSPDGTRIAFESNRSGNAEIWLSDAEGADPERITSFNGPFTNAPSWCSDGRRIAFESQASGLSAIYVEDISERVPRKVVTSVNNLTLPAWSSDCRWLFAIANTWELYRFPSSGGPAERFSQHPSNYPVVIGDRLVFTTMWPDGVTLWVKPVNGGLEAPLENMPRLSYGDVWVATAKGIYYTNHLTSLATLNFYDFATRQHRAVMPLKQIPTPAGPGIEVSPDGHWLLYSQIDSEQSEIVLAPTS